MYRSILSKCRKTLTLFNLKSNYYCSKPRTFAEINQVTLVGTLISGAYTLPSGTKSLTMRTYDPWSENENHSVLSRGFDGLKAGQRIYVNGSLASSLFNLEDGKIRKEILIRAARVIVFDDQFEGKIPSTDDINHVDIVANVCRKNTVSKNNSAIFEVATHFERNSDDGKTIGTDYISIIPNEDLKEIATSLDVNEKVAINGKIMSKSFILPNGTKNFSGLIAAERIENICWAYS